jgi:hypothetical protein
MRQQVGWICVMVQERGGRREERGKKREERG